MFDYFKGGPDKNPARLRNPISYEPTKNLILYIIIKSAASFFQVQKRLLNTFCRTLYTNGDGILFVKEK